ncbi:MAG: hypothetical protein EOM87_06725 [Clostridia bacterium]|nr:hypothetical protein [Clostridia bacterium]
MKTILKRNKLTNEIICDAGEYEILKSRGTTDEAIMEMLTKFNKTKPDVYAEIVELNDIAEFYYKKKDTVYKDKLNEFEQMADCLRELACEIETYIENARKG